MPFNSRNGHDSPQDNLKELIYLMKKHTCFSKSLKDLLLPNVPADAFSANSKAHTSFQKGGF